MNDPHRRPTLATTLWSGWAGFGVATLLALLCVTILPRPRSLVFPLALRLVVLGPACLGAAMAAAFAFRVWSPRIARVHLALVFGAGAAAALLALAGVSIATTAAAILLAAAAIGTLVPSVLERPRRSRVGAVGLGLFGMLALVGAGLAAATESPARVELPPRALFDVEHRFVDLKSGARIHYVDEGSGDTILFLHGNPSWSFQWRDSIRGLRGDRRCVALDFPGFGWSTPPAGFGFTPAEESRVLEEFVDHLGLRDVTLVVQDWGGPIGFAFAERRPELVRAFVLGSTWAWPTAKNEPRGMWSVIAGGPLGEFLQINYNGIASAGIESSIVHPPARDVLDAYRRPFLPLERRGIASFYPAQITAQAEWFAELEAGLPRVARKRALILWALEDRGFPNEDRRRWERALPEHETVELAHASHFFFEDAADRVVTEIRGFTAP